MTFLLCKVIYRCKKAGARGIASAFEIFISSNCQRLLYSKGQKFHSINKASNGTRSYGEIAIKGSTKPFISRAFCFQQPLQNRVPRVRVLLPLPSKKPPKTAEMRGFRGFFIPSFECSISAKIGQKRGVNLKNASQMQVKIQIVFYRPFIKTDIKKHIIYTAKAIQRECCIFPDLKGGVLCCR